MKLLETKTKVSIMSHLLTGYLKACRLAYRGGLSGVCLITSGESRSLNFLGSIANLHASVIEVGHLRCQFAQESVGASGGVHGVADICLAEDADTLLEDTN